MTTTNHGLGRGRVISLVLAGTVLVGGLGAVAGVVFDPSPAAPPALAGSSLDLRSAPAGPGRSVGGLLPTDSETADPNMVGALYDLGFGPYIYVPTDWSVYQRMDTRLWVTNGKGSFGFAAMGQVQPGSVTAGSVLQQNVDGLLPPDVYTQLDTTGPEDWEKVPYGDVVSRSVMTYQALWTDPQGAVPIYGQIYAAVRRDGVVLVVLIEHVPPDDWNATRFPREAIVGQSVLRFAGLG